MSVGVDNVRTVFARWTHLPDQAFRLLMFMALVTLDSDDPPTFWLGREGMAYALGRITPPEPAEGDMSERAEMFRKAREADFRTVRRALSQLVAAGVVGMVQASSPKGPAIYALDLHRGNRGQLLDPTGDTQCPGQGTLDVPRDGGVGGVTFGAKGRNNRRRGLPNVSTSLAVVLNYAEANRFLAAMPDCGISYMERVTESCSITERVILAATLAKKEAAS